MALVGGAVLELSGRADVHALIRAELQVEPRQAAGARAVLPIVASRAGQAAPHAQVVHGIPVVPRWALEVAGRIQVVVDYPGDVAAAGAVGGRGLACEAGFLAGRALEVICSLPVAIFAVLGALVGKRSEEE